MSKANSGGGGELTEPLAGSVEFETATFGVVCGGPSGCGAYVATSGRDRHRRFHAALAALVPAPRSGQE